MIYFLEKPILKISKKNGCSYLCNCESRASLCYKLVGTWKNPVNYRSLVSTGLLIETKIKSMRHISTQFFCLFLLLSTAYAQDSSNLKIQGLKIQGRRLPLSTADTEPVIIRLRCGYSNLHTEPLIVIDGVVAEKFELRNINPDDIECIWILKDNAATALYGCRAASGVILVTTKCANDRTLTVKDMLTGEILAGANVDLISMEGKKDTIHLITDSTGKVITNKIVYGKEYELNASNVGYKNFRCIVNTKQLGKNYNVLLERNYEDLEEVRIKRIDNVKLYPNPVLRFQKFNIEFENEEDTKLTVRLYCLNGKLISSSELQIKKGVNKISYSPNGSLTAGMYVLQVINENNRILKTDKLIIQ
jgi:TonB-dependent SusC/RagA subfamily outer membrane receptor